MLQYELKLTDGLTCGGAYLKFLTATADFDPAELTDGTPYTVMFGPDKCGSTNKVRPLFDQNKTHAAMTHAPTLCEESTAL